MLKSSIELKLIAETKCTNVEHTSQEQYEVNKLHCCGFSGEGTFQVVFQPDRPQTHPELRKSRWDIWKTGADRAEGNYGVDSWTAVSTDKEGTGILQGALAG